MTGDAELLDEVLDALAHLVAVYRGRAQQAAAEAAARLAELYEQPALGAYRSREDET